MGKERKFREEFNPQSTRHGGDPSREGLEAVRTAQELSAGIGALDPVNVGTQLVERFAARGEYESSEAGRRKHLRDTLVGFGCGENEAEALMLDMDTLDEDPHLQRIDGGESGVNWTITKHPEGGHDIEVRINREVREKDPVEVIVQEIDDVGGGETLRELLDSDAIEETVLEQGDMLTPDDAGTHAIEHLDAANKNSPARTHNPAKRTGSSKTKSPTSTGADD